MTIHEIIGQQYPPMDDEVIELRVILGENKNDVLWALAKAFTYGKILGVRAERAKRKK